MSLWNQFRNANRIRFFGYSCCCCLDHLFFLLQSSSNNEYSTARKRWEKNNNIHRRIETRYETKIGLKDLSTIPEKHVEAWLEFFFGKEIIDLKIRQARETAESRDKKEIFYSCHNSNLYWFGCASVFLSFFSLKASNNNSKCTHFYCWPYASLASTHKTHWSLIEVGKKTSIWIESKRQNNLNSLCVPGTTWPKLGGLCSESDSNTIISCKRCERCVVVELRVG